MERLLSLDSDVDDLNGDDPETDIFSLTSLRSPAHLPLACSFSRGERIGDEFNAKPPICELIAFLGGAFLTDRFRQGVAVCVFAVHEFFHIDGAPT